MSQQFDNTNRGAIWPNDRREKETHPHFTGTLNVEGKEYWVSAWKKKPDAKPGAPSLSFSVNPKDDNRASKDDFEDSDFEDDIPF